MNKIILLTSTIFVLVLIGCNNGNNSQTNPGGFTVQGNIKSIDSGWAYLQHEDSTGLVWDSAKIQNHAFTFTGKVAEPTLYHFWAGKESYYISHSGLRRINPDAPAFFIEDTTIQITIQDAIDKAVVSSTPSQDMYIAYKKVVAPFELKQHTVDSIFDKADERKDKVTTDSLDKVSDQITKEKAIAVASFAESNATSMVSAWAAAAAMLYEPDLDALKKVYGSFSPAVQQSSYGQKIKQAIAITPLVDIGQTAPDFTQNDTAGKPVSLSSFRGKYVLVDFWASWCPDCRRENPNVVRMFNKYKDKNFTILGVSLDSPSKKQAWLNTIHDEELTWTQVSDLKFWKNAAAVVYGVRSIPSNYLINPDGKIIARNLMGADLDKALAENLK